MLIPYNSGPIAAAVTVPMITMYTQNHDSIKMTVQAEGSVKATTVPTEKVERPNGPVEKGTTNGRGSRTVEGDCSGGKKEEISSSSRLKKDLRPKVTRSASYDTPLSGK